MPLDRFLIAPFDSESGLQTNLKPFMVPDQAFAELNNAYCWRGRIRKRFGSRWMGNDPLLSRLRISVATLGSGNASGTVPSNSGAVGQLFSIQDNIFTVNVLGTPANMLIDGVASTATFNTSTGQFVFTGVGVADGTAVFWYPSLPVMGLVTYGQNAVNDDVLIAFDTRYAYIYNSGWTQFGTGANTWAGDNSQFFWGATYTGILASDIALFVTNFNENEQMRYIIGTGGAWTNFQPIVSFSTTITMKSALILVPFKNRLLAFNIWESTSGGSPIQYPNRMRYSGIRSPIDNSGASYYPWNSDVGGLGGGIDCPFKENIVTVQFIKDRLIVFLDESTWEIVFTGNQQQPFAWQQINTELGAEGTFSVVPFDKIAIGVGNLGIIACTGNNVERIDDKIPDTIFGIHNTDSGPERVYGIRDYFVEMIYWTFPTTKTNSSFPYPNQVLVYNYKNGTWALNDDSFTAFGYYQPVDGITWDSLVVTWDGTTSWDNVTTNALFKNVVAGNQEGWVVVIDAEEPQNCSALQITDMSVGANNVITVTSIDHNLHGGDYVYFEDITGTGNLELINGTIFPVIDVAVENPNSFTFQYFDGNQTVIAGTYQGGGIMARVSNIQLLTKQYNFYMDQGYNANVTKVDFLVDATPAGQIRVDYYVSTNEQSMVLESQPYPIGTGSIVGTSNLDTFPYPDIAFELESSQLWHPLYLQANGEFIQLNLQMNDAQMRNPAIRQSDFQLHRMLFWAQKTSSRPQ